ncbi:MAG: hypothetical protein V4574_22040 [Pseudomonadota bacterium]
MAARPVLIVVVAGDAKLRSALAKRLAMHGAELLTASSWGDGLLDRAMIREPAILVAEEAAIAGEPGDWLERQRQGGRWRRVVMLTEATPAAGDHDWLVPVHRRSARALLAALYGDGTSSGPL